MSKKRRTSPYLALILLLLSFPSIQSMATVSELATADEMANLADRILIGRVRDIRISSNEYGWSIIQAEVDIEKKVKGFVTPPLNIRMIAHDELLSGESFFRSRRKALIFLYPDSRIGLTSFVGGRQGVLPISIFFGMDVIANPFPKDPRFSGSPRLPVFVFIEKICRLIRPES